MIKLLNVCVWLITFILFECNSYGQSLIQTTSPCPQIFQYNRSGHGDFIVPTPRFGDKVLVQVDFILFGRLTSQDVGSLTLFRSQEETYRMILNGDRYIRFVIRFPRVLTNFLPQIIQISYNGSAICSGITDDRTLGVRSLITLKYCLYTQKTFGNNIQPPINCQLNDFDNFGNNFDGYQAGQITDQTFSRPHVSTNHIINNNNIQNFNDVKSDATYPGLQNMFRYERPQSQQRPNRVQSTITNSLPQQQIQQPPSDHTLRPSIIQNYPPHEATCGEIDSRLRNIPLIYGGKNITRGTWPWLTAIFLSKDRSLEFRCGGNLVSNRIVVSAAHCFIIEGIPILASRIFVHLGSYNLDLWDEKGREMRQALSIKIHHEYNKEYHSAEADIAVVVLKLIVEYNLFIRPLCLWSGNTDLRHIVNSMATVVGWGLTETGELVNEARSIDIPIVSDAVCRQSQLRYITSERTFCAGARNGFGPCNGDSGSGLAMLQNDKWVLRGIVSTASTLNPTRNICDLSQFVVYTDVAKFTEFITQYI